MATSSYTTGYTVPYTGNQALQLHKELVNKEKRITKMQEERLNIKSPLYYKTPEELAMARSVYGVRLRPRPAPVRMYDRIHHQLPPDWDPKTKTDAYRLKSHFETNARIDDKSREIPILGNNECGHRLNAPPQLFKRAHARVQILRSSAFRTNGVNLDNHPGM